MANPSKENTNAIKPVWKSKATKAGLRILNEILNSLPIEIINQENHPDIYFTPLAEQNGLPLPVAASKENHNFESIVNANQQVKEYIFKNFERKYFFEKGWNLIEKKLNETFRGGIPELVSRKFETLPDGSVVCHSVINLQRVYDAKNGWIEEKSKPFLQLKTSTHFKITDGKVIDEVSYFETIAFSDKTDKLFSNERFEITPPVLSTSRWKFEANPQQINKINSTMERFAEQTKESDVIAYAPAVKDTFMDIRRTAHVFTMNGILLESILDLYNSEVLFSQIEKQLLKPSNNIPKADPEIVKYFINHCNQKRFLDQGWYFLEKKIAEEGLRGVPKIVSREIETQPDGSLIYRTVFNLVLVESPKENEPITDEFNRPILQLKTETHLKKMEGGVISDKISSFKFDTFSEQVDKIFPYQALSCFIPPENVETASLSLTMTNGIQTKKGLAEELQSNSYEWTLSVNESEFLLNNELKGLTEKSAKLEIETRKAYEKYVEHIAKKEQTSGFLEIESIMFSNFSPANRDILRFYDSIAILEKGLQEKNCQTLEEKIQAVRKQIDTLQELRKPSAGKEKLEEAAEKLIERAIELRKAYLNQAYMAVLTKSKEKTEQKSSFEQYIEFVVEADHLYKEAFACKKALDKQKVLEIKNAAILFLSDKLEIKEKLDSKIVKYVFDGLKLPDEWVLDNKLKELAERNIEVKRLSKHFSFNVKDDKTLEFVETFQIEQFSMDRYEPSQEKGVTPSIIEQGVSYSNPKGSAIASIVVKRNIQLEHGKIKDILSHPEVIAHDYQLAQFLFPNELKASPLKILSEQKVATAEKQAQVSKTWSQSMAEGLRAFMQFLGKVFNTLTLGVFAKEPTPVAATAAASVANKKQVYLTAPMFALPKEQQQKSEDLAIKSNLTVTPVPKPVLMTKEYLKTKDKENSTKEFPNRELFTIDKRSNRPWWTHLEFEPISHRFPKDDSASSMWRISQKSLEEELGLSKVVGEMPQDSITTYTP